MPKIAGNLTPKYRKHKASGQGIVTINGKDHYLGPYGTAASRKEYDRLISEWIANGRTATLDKPVATIIEVLAAYLKFAKPYYGQSGEYDNMLYALKPLKALYGTLPAAEFSPLKLKAVRQKLIESNLCRNEVNQRIGRIKRFFGWAVENELIPPSVLHGLRAVRGLARGRSDARESDPVKPVPEAYVDAVQAKVSPQIWAMVQLQRFTGMRPGEVTIMRTADIDTSGNVWVYSPAHHKTAWRGHDRKIYLGPRAQQVVKAWLRTDLDGYLFQPREADAWHRERRHKARKTPASCGNRIGTNRVRGRKAKRRPGERYAVLAYCDAVRRACQRADVPIWSPNQLRHNAATWLRKEFGLDVARVVLGHRSPAITEVYAELDSAKAQEVMGKVG
jgi:integrase